MSRLSQEVTAYQRPLVAEDARRRWGERRGLILTLRDATGVVGRGEAAPLPGYSLETYEDAERTLRGLTLSADPGQSLRELWEQVDRRWPASVRFAVESALLEYWAIHHHQSIEQALGARPEPFRVAHLIGEPNFEAVALALPGADTLKVKIGRPGRLAEELEFLAELTRRCDLPIRVDANQAFHEETPAVLGALAELGVELVEEPCPETLSLHDSPVALALDESLFQAAPSPSDLAERPFIRALVLKPTCLGLAQTLTLAWRGPAPIVSHTYEGPIGQRILAAVARSLESPYAHGVGPYRHGDPS